MSTLATWQQALSQDEKKQLSQCAARINQTVDETAKTVKHAKISIGHVLNEARDVLPSDAAFGEWARASTPFDSSQTWNPLMHIARAEEQGILSDEMIDNSSPAVLAKVIRLPEATRDALLQQIEEGDQIKRSDVPTVAQATAAEERATGDTPFDTGIDVPVDVPTTTGDTSSCADDPLTSTDPSVVIRGISALHMEHGEGPQEAAERIAAFNRADERGVQHDVDDKPEPTAAEEAREQVKKERKQATATEKVERQQANWQEIIDSSFEKRLDAIRSLLGAATQLELALALLGLDTDPQVLSNERTLNFIVQGLHDTEAQTTQEEMQITAAEKVINEAREEW